MASRPRHTLSRSWYSAVAGLWRNVGGSLSSSALKYRRCSDGAVNGRVSPSPSVGDPISREFLPAIQWTPAFGAQRSVYERNAYPGSGPTTKLSRTALNEEQLPARHCFRATRNVAQEPCHSSPRPGFVSGQELPIGSARGRGYTLLPSANITSDAIAILKHRRQQGLPIDSYMFVKILKQCSMQKDLKATRQVHDFILQSGMQKQRYVATTLLNAYIKCGRLQDAHQVFDGLKRTYRNVITWNGMIGAYSKSGCGMEAYRLFLQMKREGFEPNAVTYMSILNASASAGALEWVKEVHIHALEAGLESDLRVGNALVHMYAKSGSIGCARLIFDRLEKRDVVTWNIMLGAYAENGNIDDARLVFDRIEKRNVITWTTMIGAYAESGRGMEAYRLFLQMKREGFEPNAITYISILNASASAGALEWVKEVHSHAVEAGLESDLRVGNALIHMYAKSGSIDHARLVFDKMEKRDVVTWTAMIAGLAHHGCGHEAVKLFRKMNAESVKPNGTTFVAILSACCHAGLLDDGRTLFLAMTKDYGIKPTVVHYTCMVDLLGRCGQLEEAKLFISGMPVEPNGITWKTFLGACKTYGDVELGELAAKEVLKLEPKDSSPYVLLSNIYAAAGKWEEVSSMRTMMEEQGVRKEAGCSQIEVDNKIHEFVSGDTSHRETKEIYTMLKKLTEKLKAEGYIPDTKLVLQNIDEADKELSLCSHSEKLAIAYGLLHVPRGKPILIFKNLRVCSDCHTATKFISKVTGREITVRDANRFHHFKDGVCSCHDYW